MLVKPIKGGKISASLNSRLFASLASEAERLWISQFEREVTGERIRNKNAASKRKGMWMGGYPRLGYEANQHRLIVSDGRPTALSHCHSACVASSSRPRVPKEFVAPPPLQH